MTTDARLLLGALIVVPGALDACCAAELIELQAWTGDELRAVMGLLAVRSRSGGVTNRLVLLTEWLRGRSIRPVDALRPALNAFEASAGPWSIDAVRELARSVRAQVPA